MSCFSYDCLNNCCNYYGYCPENYGYMNSTEYNSCWTVYTNNNEGIKLEVIIGSVVGAFISLLIVVLLKCRDRGNNSSQFTNQVKHTPMNSPQNHRSIIIVNLPQNEEPETSFKQPDLKEIYEQSYGQPSGQLHGGLSTCNYEQAQGEIQKLPFVQQSAIQSSDIVEQHSEHNIQLVSTKKIIESIGLTCVQSQTQQPIIREDLNDMP